ncbi:hypothetical protein [Intestinibacter sp.]
MNYKQSSIFSSKQKVDCRNLCLYLNFKNEKADNILKLMKLIEKDLIEKFEDDFVFDMEFDEEPITTKSLHKKFKNVGDNLSRRMNLFYDAILKTDQISNRAQYRNLVINKGFMDNWVLETPQFEYDLENIESIKNYIVSNIDNEKVNYIIEPTPQDIGLNFSTEYIKKQEDVEACKDDNDFGYYGSLSFNISGYILDYDFEYFTNYLKQFISKCSDILKSLCANIFISEKNLKTEYFNLFETEFIEHKEIKDNYTDYVNHNRYGFLSGVEGINFIPNDLFNKINKNLLENDLFKVEVEENGVFININKELDKVNIHDKYKIREVLDNVLIKGYCDHNLIHFMEFLGKVPIYLDEVTLVEALDEKTRQDIYNKYFVITKNREVGDLKLDSEKFRVHKIKQS